MGTAVIAIMSFIIGMCSTILLIFIPIVKPKKSKQLTKEEWKAGMNENNTL